MELTFLGGAAGVGATCLRLDVAGRTVVVDAGVRMGGTGDRLPDLAALGDAPLAAIFVTHAHADHIGALPLVHQYAPDAPIYATAATIRLIEVMLGDARKVMDRRAADEGDVPLYDATLVESTLAQLRPLPMGASVSVPELPDVVVHVARAGHIAGAVSLGFETDAGRVLISGDVSVTPQRTVLGAALPSLTRPNLLVLESTYGTQLHPNREREEQRLADAVAAVIARGGHCLIPAFALGRAQEAILVLRAAQQAGRIPTFPIYVDGLVRTICATYAALPQALHPQLARRIQHGQPPFFDRVVQPIGRAPERDEVLGGAPCCIITSSGMLTGGPSVWFAERLAPDARHAILLTGYQDEEAPGRALQAIGHAGSGSLTLGERAVPVRCQVATYRLSAHADGGELAALVAQIKPHTVALVHGDALARQALAARLRSLTTVLVPEDGDTIPILAGGRSQVRGAASLPPTLPHGIGQGAPLDAAARERMWTLLRTEYPAYQVVSSRELAQLWYAAPGVAEEDDVVELLDNAPKGMFVALPDVGGLWRVGVPAPQRTRPRPAPASVNARPARPDQYAMQQQIAAALGDDPTLYRRSIDPESGVITLHFHFPLVAREHHAEALATLAATLGVPVHVHPQGHQEALMHVVRRVLPADLVWHAMPQVFHDAHLVVVALGAQVLADDVLRDAQAALRTQTGWTLQVRAAPVPSAPAAAVPEPLPVTSAEGHAPISEAVAFTRTREHFPRKLTSLARVGASHDTTPPTLRLYFAFPEIARAQFPDRVAALADATGWQVVIHPVTNQAQLIIAFKGALLTNAVQRRGGMQIDAATTTLTQMCVSVRGQAALDGAAAMFTHQTGWTAHLTLLVEPPG